MSKTKPVSELNMRSISKSFAGVPALKNVDFNLKGGEIHALLGANGAGKSTLMKILSGAYETDEGTIESEVGTFVFRSPADSKKAGIHCVYQEVDTSLVSHLSVSENIFLDQLANSKGNPWLKWGSLHDAAGEVLKRIGLTIAPQALIRDLTLSEKQLVLIARLLAEEAKFVILDEPTAPLSLDEADKLFGIMRGLKDSGIGVIFISHRLPEVFRICDRITVMRDGERVLTERKEDIDSAGVVRAMLGKSFEEEFPKLPATIGEPILSVRGLEAGRRVRSVDLDVRRGEIVAIVGLVGAGKTELSRVLFGADAIERGTISVEGRSVKLGSPSDAVRAGIALIPEERRKEGILVRESVLHNLSLPILKAISRFGFLSGKSEREFANGQISGLGIKTASVSQLAAFLSGGNQQKVAIGKWLGTEAEVFLFDEPTKGVDVGAKSDIFRIIGKLAQKGKGILYLTCEFAEALGLADRILVMCDGFVVKSFSRGEATQEDLLYYASAGREELA
ncbi:sugar ABC transporter ATP-binding protein [Cohnella lupini]|uniref:Simple sugar transport system ATP-binding protein n=1 Tax=Cohnella lupini TaxID=1294267 RepID=A0A3D9IFG8_9BACL|nr:sugar ABC transporter ATP-binding protein [Cohnella lupini]RED60460.1 simple sugar transport system ATP-binding protein [Cohnella lupini]